MIVPVFDYALNEVVELELINFGPDDFDCTECAYVMEVVPALQEAYNDRVALYEHQTEELEDWEKEAMGEGASYGRADCPRCDMFNMVLDFRDKKRPIPVEFNSVEFG